MELKESRSWRQPSTGVLYKQKMSVNVFKERYGEDADGNRGITRWAIDEIDYTGNWEDIDDDTFTDEDWESWNDVQDTEDWSNQVIREGMQDVY